MCDDNNGKCMVDACFCCYDGIDCKDIELGCRHEHECICLKQGLCISASAEPLGCGLTTDKEEDSSEICKIGLFCCDMALVKPSTCCAGAETLCCLYSVCSFPFDEEFLNKLVCSFCGLACAPTCGCCVAPPDCPAIEKIRKREAEPIVAAEPMDRGGEGGEEKK
eukprot:CAMPEP_0197182862 /NCGR_PEP_ID=MMETSP1423-20130617/6987_1 /TAXON_ID=476441 /ORGANISM="Pseudo-nitzschia heimii, Strain UNC1101" /LENGTH=164 /DNA_ID=CAMNT_0042633361 /DNA_START=98 /DNA_END=592 /DNA_ORIENTATION=-